MVESLAHSDTYILITTYLLSNTQVFDRLRDLAISQNILIPEGSGHKAFREATSKRASMRYVFLGQEVCRDGWLTLHGIGKGRFQTLLQSVLAGALSPPMDKRYITRARQTTVSPVWGEVHGYILQLYESVAETLPDDALSEADREADTDQDSNDQTPIVTIHKDGCAEVCVSALDTSKVFREERYLPPGSMLDQYKQMCVTHPHLKCSFKLFWSVWCRDFWFLKFRRVYRHAVCQVCLKHKWLIRQLLHDCRSRLRQRKLFDRHLESQYRDRQCYWQVRQESRLHRKSICIIADAMDQAKFMWPRSIAFSSHQFDSVVRPRLHVCAVLIHGYIDLLTISHADVHTGGSNTVHLLCHVLTLLANDGVVLEDKDLIVQLDNAASSNKNRTVLTFLATLPALGAVDTASAYFLRSGHSHEDVDQQHGQLGVFHSSFMYVKVGLMPPLSLCDQSWHQQFTSEGN